MTDPTRIEIANSPITMRMSGMTMHGLIPFDVPYISEVAHNLWQGGCADGLVLPENIDHVISLYPWERYIINHGAQREEICMYDSLDQSFEQVDEIASKVNMLRRLHVVLVHCQAGLNRSSLIVARALMFDGMTPQGAISLIREKRSPACLCNPAFEEWLLSF